MSGARWANMALFCCRANGRPSKDNCETLTPMREFTIAGARLRPLRPSLRHAASLCFAAEWMGRFRETAGRREWKNTQSLALMFSPSRLFPRHISREEMFSCYKPVVMKNCEPLVLRPALAICWEKQKREERRGQNGTCEYASARLLKRSPGAESHGSHPAKWQFVQRNIARLPTTWDTSTQEHTTHTYAHSHARTHTHTCAETHVYNTATPIQHPH